MRRALHIGLFLGILIGMSACAAAPASEAIVSDSRSVAGSAHAD